MLVAVLALAATAALAPAVGAYSLPAANIAAAAMSLGFLVWRARLVLGESEAGTGATSGSDGT